MLRSIPRGAERAFECLIVYRVCMAWTVGQSGAAGRRERAAWLGVLVLLVSTHLLGAVHGPAFAGPHTPVATASCARASAGGDADLASRTHGHDHEHGHGLEDSVDHAVDRLPTPVDHVLDGAGDAAPHESVQGVVSAGPVRRPQGRARPADGQITLALLCVSRR